MILVIAAADRTIWKYEDGEAVTIRPLGDLEILNNDGDVVSIVSRGQWFSVEIAEDDDE